MGLLEGITLLVLLENDITQKSCLSLKCINVFINKYDKLHGDLMAATILDIDLAKPITEIDIPETQKRVLSLIRWRGKPVGQLWLPTSRGELTAADVRDKLIDAAGMPLRELWLNEWLISAQLITTEDREVPSVTIAVCTRDRPEDLRNCLNGLTHLLGCDEILVVDNRPMSDATFKLAQSYPQVRYVREDRPGLNVARNRAICEARHDIVAFIDDDAIPDPMWLKTVRKGFDDGRVMCVTGLTWPFELATDAQECREISHSFGRGYTRKLFDSSVINPMASGQAGAGVNMAIRKQCVNMFGEFDEALDAGTPTKSGGDNEMFSRILAGGYQILYDPAALVWHVHRKTWPELRRTFFGYGVGVYAAWTRSILHDRQFGALAIAGAWAKTQIKSLLRSIRRLPDAPPTHLILLEMLGCFCGPTAYLYSRHKLRQKKQ